MTGNTNIDGCSNSELSLVMTTAPGNQSSHNAKIKINIIPLTNSGVPVANKLVVDRNRSIHVPSFNPANIPNAKAKGITTANAIPPKSKVFLIRVSNVSITGRPVKNDTPGSPRNNPFCSGIYLRGAPAVFFHAALVNTQLSNFSPFTHIAACPSRVTPQ